LILCRGANIVSVGILEGKVSIGKEESEGNLKREKFEGRGNVEYLKTIQESRGLSEVGDPS
jgi:hypothetical protein